jgi:uncharacterized protein (TIGR00290 family)
MADAQPRVAVAWSGGKDATTLLDRLLAREDCTVVELFTTAIEDGGPTTTHRVPRELMSRQADALGLPIRFVDLPADRSTEAYEAALDRVFDDYERRGVDRVAYADLFLEGIREYREKRLADRDVEGWWPLWGADTADLARAVVDRFAATVTCVDAAALDASFAGRRYDGSLLAALPDDVDPCGEHGEFHTFVHDGPPFREPVPVDVGESATREASHGSMTMHYRELK